MLKLKKMIWVWSLIGTLLVGISSVASADVIYDQTLSDTDNYGFISNIGGDLSADNFITTRNYLLQSITWYGMYESAGVSTTDTFYIKIFNTSGNELFGESYFSADVVKSYSGVDDAYDEMIYQYQVAISDWTISADSYLLSISNSNSDYSNWYWADGLGGDGISYYFDSGSWVAENAGIDMAFSIGGVQAGAPMPEPSTFVLLAFGMLGIAGFGRRVKE